MRDFTNDELIAIARKSALDSTHRYSYMPVLEEESSAWFPHAWVIEAMRHAIDAAFENRAIKSGEDK